MQLSALIKKANFWCTRRTRKCSFDLQKKKDLVDWLNFKTKDWITFQSNFAYYVLGPAKLAK